MLPIGLLLFILMTLIVAGILAIGIAFAIGAWAVTRGFSPAASVALGVITVAALASVVWW